MECHAIGHGVSKAIMCSSWMLYRTCWIMWLILNHMALGLCTFCLAGDKDVIMPPASPAQPQGHLLMVIDWIPTTEQIPCLVQLVPEYEPWYKLVGSSHRRMVCLWPRGMARHYVGCLSDLVHNCRYSYMTRGLSIKIQDLLGHVQ